MDHIVPLTFENDSYKLVIAADRMKALLWLKKSEGLSETGSAPVFKDIIRILNVHGVLTGLKQKDLTDGLQKLASNLKPGMIVAAEGQPAVDGTHYDYRFAVPMARPTIDTWLETGSLDMIIRSQEPVKKGTIILEINPGIKGSEGINVQGEPLPFKSFPIIRVQAGLHVRSQNNRRFVADIDGFIQIEKNFISIIPFEEMHIHTEISADEMEATVRFEKESLHTLPPTRDSVLEALRFAGISSCIDIKAVERAVSDVKTGSYQGEKVKIARGRFPVEGRSAKIRFNFKIDPDKLNLMPDAYTYDSDHDSLFHK
jgi:uncharacterized protein (DUF342 family)